MVTKRQPGTPRKASRFTSKINPKHQTQVPAQMSPAYLQQLQALLAAQQLVGQAPNPNTGRRTKRGPAGASLPVLPQLGNGQVVPGQVVNQAPSARMEASAAMAAIRSAAYRHRWQLTPAAAATLTTIGAAIAPGAATFGMTVAAALALLAAHKGPDEIAGRTWLSKAERHIATRWLGSAAGWTSGVWVADTAGMHWTGTSLGFAAAALVAVTGPASLAWMKSREIRKDDKPGELSDEAKALLVAWPHTVGGPTGPEKLRGSRIVTDTLREPSPGTIAFAVALRDEVHGEDAVGDEVRKPLERMLRMGIGTVDLEKDREDSGQINVTLTPTRHLEKVAAVWDGPILNKDGTIDLALTPDGRDIAVALFNESGVEHGMIVGTSNVGKSFTLAAQVLPGVCEGLEVVFYIDGGQGTSAPHLAGACDWWAVDGPEEWIQVIQAAHAVMRSRKARRKLERVSKWRGRDEKDPILTLVIDEATTAKGELPDWVQELVMEMLREGRKLGVRVIQVTQDPMGEDLIGGRKARGLMGGNGTMIGHRPGEGTANMLTGSGTSEKIDLLKLPPEPGWCGIIRRGQVLTKAARVKYATEEKVEGVLAPITPRGLAGADLTAAGTHYPDRVQGRQVVAELKADAEGVDQATDTPPAAIPARVTPPQMPASVPASRTADPVVKETGINAVTNAAARFRQAQGEMNAIAIKAELRAVGEAGATTAELMSRLGLAKATVNRQIKALVDDGKATRGNDGRVRLLQEAA